MKSKLAANQSDYLMTICDKIICILYICKGCKEEGGVSTLVPARYGFESRIGRANLACKFRSKIIKPSNLMCFIETYREGITKISNKICSQKVTDSYESPKDTEAARLRLPVCVMW